MTSTTRSTRGHSLLARLIAMMAVGLLMLSLGATTAFAGSGAQTSDAAGNAGPKISSDGAQGALNEDDEDDDDDEDEEDEEDEDDTAGGGGGGGGGGLPATDTVFGLTGHASDADAALNEDDEDDDEDDEDDDEDDEDEEDTAGGGGRGGGGLPATDSAPELAGSAGSVIPAPAVALLLIAGLVVGAVKITAKRPI